MRQDLLHDIETLPPIDMHEEWVSNWMKYNPSPEPVKRQHRTKPETVEAETKRCEAKDKQNMQEWEEKAQKQFAGKSLQPTEGRILCISLAIDNPEQYIDKHTPTPRNNGDTIVLYANYHEWDFGDENCDYTQWCDAEERRILEEFHLLILGRDLTWCGWNNAGFDMPWLRLRALRYNLRDLARSIPYIRKDMFEGGKIWDGMTINSGPGRGPNLKLENMSQMLFGRGKAGITGADIYPKWTSGDHDSIKIYSNSEMDVLRDVMMRTRF